MVIHVGAKSSFKSWDEIGSGSLIGTNKKHLDLNPPVLQFHIEHSFFQHSVPHTNTHNSKCHLLSGGNYSVGGSLAFNPGCDFALWNKMCFRVSQMWLESFLVRAETQLGCRIFQTHKWIVWNRSTALCPLCLLLRIRSSPPELLCYFPPTDWQNSKHEGFFFLFIKKRFFAPVVWNYQKHYYPHL